MFEIEKLVQYLEDLSLSHDWLREIGIKRPNEAARCLQSMVETGLTLDLVAAICDQLGELLPKVSDPDRALHNLERFVAAARNPLSLGSLIDRDRETLPTLLAIFSASQYLSDVLVRDPESFDLLRLTAGQPVVRQVLVDEICSEVESAEDDEHVLSILRRYKHRETLRIAYGDLIGKQRLETVTLQISHLADAICEAATRYVRRALLEKFGAPKTDQGQTARFVILALGKLGGEELNYSSDIDLIFLCEAGGSTDGPRSISHAEYFDRLQRKLVRLLTETTADGSAYRVDLRLRPHGSQGAAVWETQAAIRYYDVSGRTWERQAFVKARPIAGDEELGCEFLGQMESWVYRRYLSRADITGIKALKRRIENRAAREEGEANNLKTGKGGIRDVEFVIQFLQLLNGGDLPSLRTGNTLAAIDRLTDADCLRLDESSALARNYTFLRRVEHHLQIMFDLQTHTLPDDIDELRKLAIRSGYEDSDGDALERFQRDLREAADENRGILNHLLHDAFPEDEGADTEADLVLDPHPPASLVETQLGGVYRFSDPQAAHKNLLALSSEKVPFLSTRRCRHFLAAIAQRLLTAISETPDPDATLVDLSRVSDSLGGKGVLWELFSTSEASLRLYVRLCACSHYLTGLLTGNPGMIDELMDSLLLGRLPRLQEWDRQLEELLRGAEDIDPIIHSFKDVAHLRVGVRDIMGKEDIRDTHLALSNIAEACLRQVSQREYERLAERYGDPTCGDGPRQGEQCELIILALGKLGGREPNYHSDLDIIFLYTSDGVTRPRSKRGESTSNQHFFGLLSQHIIKVLSKVGVHGRLYEVDSRLRPNGRSAALAVSLPQLTRYFQEGRGQLWEKQALCKARCVYGSEEGRAETMEAVRAILTGEAWRPEFATEIREMRLKLEESASPTNLKRGAGGSMDIEFIVQMLQLRYVREKPGVVTPGTLDAIAALAHEGCLDADTAEKLADAYRFLRGVESGIRLMNTGARHDFPTDADELERLAFQLGEYSSVALAERCGDVAKSNRQLFERIFRESAH